MGVEPILPAWKAGARPLGQCRKSKRHTRVELVWPAWEAGAQPLGQCRTH